ncbi:hypothetical protein CLOM_g23859, partial [Closterium sp. NIES-68]
LEKLCAAVPEDLAKIMRKDEKIFPDDLLPGLLPERPYDHKLELEPGAQPTVRSQWRLSQPELLELHTQLDFLLAKKFIRPSTSPYTAPILFTSKKDGGLWMCTDYRTLNNFTIKSRYPIPRADDLIDQLRGAMFFPRLIYKEVTTRFVSPKLIFRRLCFQHITEVTKALESTQRKSTLFATFYEWGARQQATFDQQKTFLITPPVLRIADLECPYELVTDASNVAVGAVLLQDFGEGLQPISNDSRKIQGTGRNHPIHDKEMLAIVNAFKTWRCYLSGADVTVRSDHKSLQFIRAQPTLNPRQFRWLEHLESNFHNRITYNKGANNIADALSRPSAHTSAVLIAQNSPLLTGLD